MVGECGAEIQSQVELLQVQTMAFRGRKSMNEWDGTMEFIKGTTVS